MSEDVWKAIVRTLYGQEPRDGASVGITPADVARRTYGDQLGAVFGSRLRNADKFRNDLEAQASVDPRLVGALPSYDWRHWVEPTPHHFDPRLFFNSGITVSDPLGPVRVRLGPQNEKEMWEILAHENAHVLQAQNVTDYDAGFFRPKASMNAKMFNDRKLLEVLGFTAPSRPSEFESNADYNRPKFHGPRYDLEMDRDSTSLTYNAIKKSPNEYIAYLTPIVRHFYEVEGRPIETAEDAKKALAMYEKLGERQKQAVRAFRHTFEHAKRLMPLLTAINKTRPVV